MAPMSMAACLLLSLFFVYSIGVIQLKSLLVYDRTSLMDIQRNVGAFVYRGHTTLPPFLLGIQTHLEWVLSPRKRRRRRRRGKRSGRLVKSKLGGPGGGNLLEGLREHLAQGHLRGLQPSAWCSPTVNGQSPPQRSGALSTCCSTENWLGSPSR